MSSSFEKYNQRRLVSSYFSVVLSIFLVLFLLGSLGLFVINSTKMSNEFKENIPMTVFFKNEASSELLADFDKEMLKRNFIKDIVFVHKDSAAKNNVDIVGEDFMSFLGFNPLENSFDIHLKGAYVEKDSIKAIERLIKKNAMVSEIVYDKQLVDLVNENIKKISFWVLVVSIALMVVAMLLINSSLRLSVYSHRFTIKTMQMVGATKSFIRKPFIWRSVKLGLLGSFLALIGVVGLAVYVDSVYPSLGIMKDYVSLAIIVFGVLTIGVLITWVSTYFATQRFLNLRTDDLY
jgi:cell division transport system permease protein